MKKIDLFVVILFPLLVFILVFLFNLHINYFVSLILIFAIPSLYLSLKNKHKVKKVAWFSLLISIPVAIIVELVAFGEKAWIVPESILSYRLFGFSPFENYIWQFLTVYTILIFYEHFCNKKFQPVISKKIRVMNYIMYPLTLVVILVFLVNSSMLVIPYSYLWFGTVLFLIPTVLFIRKYPHFTLPFLKVQVFFLYVHTIFELIGLKLNHWVYLGTNFIGWVSMLGLRMPVEEFFFVTIIGAFAACTYYEFFTNKNI